MSALASHLDASTSQDYSEHYSVDGVGDRVSLLDTWVDGVDLLEASRRIDEFVRSRRQHQVVTVNLDFLRLSVEDTSFRDLINSADLAVPDGMPLIWASRLRGAALPQRVAGVDLVVECARLAAAKNYRVFLLGAGPGIAEHAASVLRERFPGLQVAGTYAPPDTSPEEDKVTVALIRAIQPDILFVAFGAPRQDQWIRKHMASLGVPVCIGVGGAFDMLSGRLSRAPVWMQQSGLEWLHRFILEPKRLFKRYFIHDLPVFVRLMLQSGTNDSQSALPAQLVEVSAAAAVDPVADWSAPLVSHGELSA